jgi:hypothetical protein
MRVLDELANGPDGIALALMEGHIIRTELLAFGLPPTIVDRLVGLQIPLLSPQGRNADFATVSLLVQPVAAELASFTALLNARFIEIRDQDVRRQ